MPSPKSGKPGLPVAPSEPAEALAADLADPGEVETVKSVQRETKKGKYGSSKAPAYKPPETAAEKKARKNWIEIELLDEEGEPVAGETYEIALPDGSVASGTLDEKGFAGRRHRSVPQVSFPNLDQDVSSPVAVPSFRRPIRIDTHATIVQVRGRHVAPSPSRTASSIGALRAVRPTPACSARSGGWRVRHRAGPARQRRRAGLTRALSPAPAH
jgi:hypothetical protein